MISENDGDVTAYAYDVWGNMTSAGSASYAYNAQGLRISKTVSGSTDNFILVGGDVWKDSENTYLRGLGLISSDDYFYLYNIRGDVIQLLNYSGEVVKTYDYDAYGNELTRDLSNENPFRYCGEYYDTETGLIYLRARYYDPSVGRFTSVDPIKDGLNWYAYCAANPVLYADKNGLFLDIVFDLVSLGFSIYDVIKNPDDIWAWAGLAGDFVDLAIPLAGGIGEAIKFADKGKDAAKTIRQLVDAKDYKKAGSWLLGAFDRGWEIEKKLGGMCNNFPTIDKFVEAATEGNRKILSSITSIKSMDVTAKTYQDANKMYNTLKKYIDQLIGFTGTIYEGITYCVDDAKRILELALPPVNLSFEQAEKLKEAIEYAQGKNIEVIIRIIE